MQIIQENCEKLIISDSNFQDLLHNNPLLDSIEISTQYNCCANIVYENTISQSDCVRVFLESILQVCQPDRTFVLYFSISGDTLDSGIDLTDLVLTDFTGNVNIIGNVTYIDSTNFSITVEILSFTDFEMQIGILATGLSGNVASLITPINVAMEIIGGQEHFTIVGVTPLCDEGTDPVIIEDGEIVIDHELFSVFNPTQLADGIYTVTVAFYLTDGTYIQYTNCIFVDCTVACKLATYMAANIGTEMSTTLAMIHYALQESEGCECVCEDKCKLFEYLWNNLSTVTTSSGCNCY